MPNMVRYKIVTVLTWTLLVGAYLPPPMLEHMPDLEEDLQSFRDHSVLGDLNLEL